MNPAHMPGPGDERSFPSHVRTRDPQTAAEIDAAESWALAQSIAHDPERLDELQAECLLDYSRISIKIDGRQTDLFGAAEYLRLCVMAGRHAEADCIARDATDALATEIEALIRAGRVA